MPYPHGNVAWGLSRRVRQYYQMFLSYWFSRNKVIQQVPTPQNPTPKKGGKQTKSDTIKRVEDNKIGCPKKTAGNFKSCVLTPKRNNRTL
jgi:hypothetical protein